MELVPLVVFGLYGGALADAWDKRRLILWTEAGQGALCAALLVNALMPSPAVWPLYVIAAFTSALGAVQRPALDSLIPRIVAHEHLPAAASLNALRWQAGGIAGPALAGVVVAYAGLGWAYAVDLVSFAASVALVAGLASAPASHEARKPSWAAIAEGAGYAWGRKELLGTYAVDIAAMLLAMPLAVLPFLADELGAEWSLGLMYAAIPAGSLLVGVSSGWTSRVHRHGRMVVLAAAGWAWRSPRRASPGTCGWCCCASCSPGPATWSAASSCSAMWNQTIPDELRGRLAGIELLRRTRLARSSVRSGRAARPRSPGCGRRCGRAGCCARARWGCWRCACRR
ncbi:MFS transporter OS=Streptomyces tendae OX=1932 GN=GUR47_11155 PE=4 SV=1 [Streptomyces tendae]